MFGLPRLFRVKQPFEGRLAVSSRPQGFDELEEAVEAWRDAGVGTVVSMMEEDEAEELGLANEGVVCRANGIAYLNCPVPDHGVPQDMAAVLGVVDEALGRLAQGQVVAAHCFAGIGRSPLFVACTLVRHGLSVEVAWERTIAARGVPLPDTDAQRRWAAAFAKRYGGAAPLC